MTSHTDVLHDELDALIPGEARTRSSIRMTLHALIAAGVVTVLQCAYEECVEKSREFIPYTTENSKHRVDKRVITIDHIINICDGGTDRPNNLRVLHFSCNSALGGKNPSAERRAKLAAGTKKRWEDPKYRALMIETSIRTGNDPEVAKRKSEMMTLRWADPEYKESRRKAISGENHWTKNLPDDPTECPKCGKVYKGSFGVSNHMKAHKNDEKDTNE